MVRIADVETEVTACSCRCRASVSVGDRQCRVGTEAGAGDVFGKQLQSVKNAVGGKYCDYRFKGLFVIFGF